MPPYLLRQLLLALSAVLLLLVAASCGSAEKSLRRGHAAAAIGEHCEAAALYRRAYRQISPRDRAERGMAAYHMAEAYRRYGNAARAIAAYRNAERYGLTDTMTYYYIGELSRLLGDYGGARNYYNLYLQQHPGDSATLRGLASCQLGLQKKEQEPPCKVALAGLFNGSRSDYAPALLPPDYDQLYFTSTRSAATGNELSGITGMKNGDLFYARKDEAGRWKAPEIVEGEVNTTFDEGAPAFSPDGQTMYLTVCRTDPQYPRMAEIWTSQRSDARWSKPQVLAITADTLSSYAHPAVSPDGEWLYFTSDMPGGYGGLDLWRARLGGQHGLGAVENLGPDINTEGNEVFPAFRPTGQLYFASDGRTPSLGGLDLYSATEDTLTGRWSVAHLPAPVNSSGDDFGITFNGLRSEGYFSSSRATGGRGWDKLYTFAFPEILQTVKGWVYEQDGYELPDATVYMVGDDGTNLKLGVRSDGSFEQPVTAGVNYLFLAICPGYLNVRQQLHADTVTADYQHVLQFPLPSISVPVLVRNIFYEFDRADITPASSEALDRLVSLLVENPNITIELGAHCDYRGDDDYNQRLSQRRAESVVRYLTEHGIAPDRLTAMGYGEQQPKVVNKRLTETYPFLSEGDTLTLSYILRLTPEQQEVCNALNRRTEFRVLRTTYGLFDEQGNLKVDAVMPQANRPEEEDKASAASPSDE